MDKSSPQRRRARREKMLFMRDGIVRIVNNLKE